MSNSISIKGTRDGLTITLGQGEMDQLLEELAQHLTTQGAFFRGGRVALQVGDRAMSAEDLARLDAVLKKQDMSLRSVLAFSLDTVNAAKDLGLAATAVQTPAVQTPAVQTPAVEKGTDIEGHTASPAPTIRPQQAAGRVMEESKGILLRRVVRSGQVVRHPGHIVILGDVHVGGEVIAGGDVLVWGRLRGVVHAGAGGNATAVVCALDLAPTQLRIGSAVARSGDDDKTRRTHPEIASLHDGAIVVEPWDQRQKGL